MKPKRKGGGGIADEAAFWVVTLSEKTNRRTWARFRVWAQRSTRHWEEFLIAVSIFRAFQDFDPRQTVDVRKWLGDSEATIVHLNRLSDVRLSTIGSANQARRGAAQWGAGCRRLAMHAAAALLLTIGVPLIGQALHLPTHQEYTTGVGEAQLIPLEGGSVIRLNERSELAVTQTPGALTVELRHGEAFFDVHHDDAHRLWLLLGNAVIEDIGTQFDVRRSPDEITVSVLEGSVKIENDLPEGVPPSNSFILAEAGQEVRIQGAHGEAQLQVQHRSFKELESRTGWAQDWVTFDGEPLVEVAQALNSHHRRQLVIADPSIAQLPVGGRFRADDLDALVKALTQVLPVRVVHSPGKSEGNVISLVRAEKSSVSHDVRQATGIVPH